MNNLVKTVFYLLWRKCAKYPINTSINIKHCFVNCHWKIWSDDQPQCDHMIMNNVVVGFGYFVYFVANFVSIKFYKNFDHPWFLSRSRG